MRCGDHPRVGCAVGLWGCHAYVLAPGMTWDDVYAAVGQPPVMDHDGWQDDEQRAAGVFPNGRPEDYAPDGTYLPHEGEL